jgi:dihydroorotate dehydrogenase (fumarate)
MGLKLKNPVVVSSSSLTGTAAGVRTCAAAGAGAVVLKSLFEEQIEQDAVPPDDDADVLMHPEASEYVQQMARYLGPRDYLDLIAEAKNTVDIPVIASVNCVSPKWWSDYTEQIERAGADAIELNISILPRGFTDASREVEDRYVQIVREARSHIDVPLAVKIGPWFTALPGFASRLVSAGADALVLFNRFYQLDVDVDSLTLTPGYQYSAPQEIYQTLRWVSILQGDVDCELAGSTGVHDARGVVKLLLVGASVAQVCSVLFERNVQYLSTIVDDLAEWMKEHDFENVSQFFSRLSQANSDNPEAHERLQYIKALTGLS